jgi:amino-acid N-acetyltransferase
MIYRKAILRDVEIIHSMVNDYANDGKMLPRSLSSLYENIRDFLVAEEDGQLLGAGALHVLWDNLAEVRTVAVRAGHMHNGIGKRLVAGLLEDAQTLGISRVFTLTYQQAFFESCGFYVIDKETLPQKVWTDCLNCPKFPKCDEICMAVDSGGNAGV